MTLQEAKDEVAHTYGINGMSWNTLQFEKNGTEEFEKIINKVAEIYARSKWDEACESQKKIIEERFSSMMDENFDSPLAEFISNEAPKPEFKP